MRLSVEDDRIKLECGNAAQFWMPKEGLTTSDVMGKIKEFADADGGNYGRAMVALKSLASPVNESEINKEGEDENSDNAITESTEEILQQDPHSDTSQDGTGGESPKPSDSLEHPDQPSPSTDILGHDAEITLNEYMSRSTFQLNEADLNVSWRQTAQGLEVRINGQLYIYDPLDPDLTVQKVFDKMERIGQHSKGKALGWLEAQRRAGNIRSYKVKDDEHSPKGWERKIQPALEAKGATQISILPSTDDWQAEFSLADIQGFINANLYSGEWSLDWNDTKEKGVGLASVVKLIADLKVPQKESIHESKDAPFTVILKDKETGKDTVDSSYASEIDADKRMKELQKDQQKSKSYAFRVEKRNY